MEVADERVKAELKAKEEEIAAYKAEKSAKDKIKRAEDRLKAEQEAEWLKLNDEG